MVEFQMMDQNHPLVSCLHAGAIPAAESAAGAYAEREYGLPEGSIARFLQAVSRAYGACGVMAVEGEQIIGKIRFWPQSLVDAIPDICVQAREGAHAIASFDVMSLPPRSGCLCFGCFQIIPEYRGRGIAAGMLSAAIGWARANGWETLHAKAIRNIRPLLDWAGVWSVEGYQRMGFQVTGHTVSQELKQGVEAMRGGCHGEAVQRQWKPYGHLSGDEAAWCYDVTLHLRSGEEAREGPQPARE